ncbi:hypothetical protein Taro_036689 [Colocasia esculenta]|uniref:Uncharacterized protein n=1 Tax=Colocasia esculenta TaxID=4460 RepID=A0A843W3R0_COLES|nr:hypothetical protein [Colocasia esculenta]
MILLLGFFFLKHTGVGNGIADSKVGIAIADFGVNADSKVGFGNADFGVGNVNADSKFGICNADSSCRIPKEVAKRIEAIRSKFLEADICRSGEDDLWAHVIRVRLGKCDKTLFWKDMCCIDLPFHTLFPSLFHLVVDPLAFVSQIVDPTLPDKVLWPDSGWQPVSLTDLITAASVKKVYRKATLCVHPDKVRSGSVQQKYIAEKVFDLLKMVLSDLANYDEEYCIIGKEESWNKFNSEELF